MARRTRQPHGGVLLPGNGPLARIPPAAAFLIVFGLFAAGAFLGGTLGGFLLLLLAALIAGLLAATWHRLPPAARVVRISVLSVLIIIAVVVMS